MHLKWCTDASVLQPSTQLYAEPYLQLQQLTVPKSFPELNNSIYMKLPSLCSATTMKTAVSCSSQWKSLHPRQLWMNYFQKKMQSTYTTGKYSSVDWADPLQHQTTDISWRAGRDPSEGPVYHTLFQKLKTSHLLVEILGKYYLNSYSRHKLNYQPDKHHKQPK